LYQIFKLQFIGQSAPYVSLRGAWRKLAMRRGNLLWQQTKHRRLPHQCAHWFAMTIFDGASQQIDKL
ncbi:hypothetical protein, partial [Klebsiella pneumoniae]|uniref:hypothetical protein n=1 Tax=Klebsiella pneumoniae TaxID=573 RepID=UPI0025A0447C